MILLSAKQAGAQIIDTIAGNGTMAYGGPATNASFYRPYGIGVDNLGNVYTLESNRLRKIDLSATINTIAGTGANGYSGDGGAAITANPFGVVYLVL